MTFEEIREMVNATINENGKREITGKAINLALLETLTAIEEYLANYKPEGGGTSEIVYLPDTPSSEIDPEHQAHNLEVYNKFKAAFEGGEPLPLLSVDLAYMFADAEEQIGQPVNVSAYSPCVTVIFIPADSPLVAEMGEGVMFMAVASGTTVQGLIQPDGNVTSIQ